MPLDRKADGEAINLRKTPSIPSRYRYRRRHILEFETYHDDPTDVDGKLLPNLLDILKSR
jgi:hypothetical protein